MLLALLVACAPDPAPISPTPADASPLPFATPHVSLPPGYEGHPLRPVPRASAAPDTVRFLVIGDGGNGNSAQFNVADAMKTVCDRDGCEFVLYAGDNIYGDGVSTVDDRQLEDKFEIPYAEFDIPFYMALGNHDYGGNGSGYEFWKGRVEVEYTDHSDRWTMPETYYDFTVGPAHIYALDTNAIVWGFVEDQHAWIQQLQAENTSPWQLAFGHHPYRSNGPHGNAGEYDGYDADPISSGAIMKSFVEADICGKVQVYFCGHDHSLQWMEPTCGSNFLVSGAASSSTDIDDGDGPVLWSAESLGFLWVEIVGDTLTARYYDDDATLLYENTIVR